MCVCVCVFVDYKTVFRVHLKYYTRKTEFQFYALFNANCVFVCVCVFVDLVLENLNNGSSLKHTYLFCTLRFYFLIIATLFFACVYLLSLFLSIAWVRCGGFVLCLYICKYMSDRPSVCLFYFFFLLLSDCIHRFHLPSFFSLCVSSCFGRRIITLCFD